MIEAVGKITRLERRVMWRKRLLSLQDLVAFAVIGSGLISAALVLLTRFGPIGFSLLPVIIGVVSVSFATALIRWLSTRAREPDAAFLIDQALKLDDRLTTSRLIIERGGPKNAFEEALIEDAAERVSARRAASVVPFRIRRWYTISAVSVTALAIALMVPTRHLPFAEAAAAERADIETAGEHLDQTAVEVEKTLQPGSETATLAKEQSELGRGFLRSPATRAEALRRLSALEERIRGRHDDLASTHADEIVSLADRRLGSALSTLSKVSRKKTATSSDQAGVLDEGAGAALRREPRTEPERVPVDGLKPVESSQAKAGKSGPDHSQNQAPAEGGKSNIDVKKAKASMQEESRKKTQEPVPGNEDRKAASSKIDSTKQKPEPNVGEPGASAARNGEEKTDGLKGAAEKTDGQSSLDRKADDQKSGEQPGALEALKAVAESVAEQAATAVPKMSEELLKKATELRSHELSPADIEKLRKAAESLSRDLSQIAQSKELQQALQEMAREMRPEQIEQVARALGSHEKLKQEFEAAARLLAQNHQAREMVAGLADQFPRKPDERRNRDTGHAGVKSELGDQGTQSGDQISRGNRAKTGDPEKLDTPIDRQLAGKGRESRLKGRLQQGQRGEYLYLQSRAGVGAARALYSSAYPQYRRNAERAVQRSQVPPNLRSVVRRYFDAINPDAQR